MLTTQELAEVEKARQTFCQTVIYLNDADEKATKASGWGTKGKLAWLESVVRDYRKEMHRIFKD